MTRRDLRGVDFATLHDLWTTVSAAPLLRNGALALQTVFAEQIWPLGPIRAPINLPPRFVIYGMNEHAVLLSH